ncbi:unnamed protein product [Paramecium sonneborni]|uniref:Protein kinase domain-containing protein n=1 Tax=Paramecium sonneborni TaxID=65129 RepID=A0A8S1QU51_9CILI|nr:unnamed protein product [Paramecium sonneborni]
MNWLQQKDEHDSIFNNGGEFWLQMKLQENQQHLIFQGKTFQKHTKTRKWESVHLELYVDKLVKITNNQAEYCNINACYLKKIKYSESSFQPYKHGFRLHYSKQRIEFFTENQEHYERWQAALKRYCILTKFNKKYKLICKHKLNEPYPSCTYKAQRNSDGLFFQIRIIEKSQLDDPSLALNEISILRRVDHVYVQRLQEVYEDQVYLYVVYDQYAGREQKFLLPQLLQTTEKVLAELLYKLLLGLHHIHSKGVFHRDIKFDNIFNRFPDCLTDSCIVNFSSADFHENKMHRRIGTPGFMAPEIFKTKQYDQQIDVFSLGVIFYYIVFGKMPFGSDFNEVLPKNEQGDIEYPDFCRISISGLQLMKLMLHKDPQKRCTSFQALNHHWFINLKIRDLLGKPSVMMNQMKMGSGLNLSTILEKSDMIDNSNMSIALTPRGIKKKSYISRSKSSDINILDQEFIYESVADKMKSLSNTIPQPSRLKHKSSKMQIQK